MQRLVEQTSDEGDVFGGSGHVGRVHYYLSVYQYFSEAADEPGPANLEVEGRITTLDALDIVELHRRESELTLHLADGRLLDFLIANREGTIHSTGRGLYRE